MIWSLFKLALVATVIGGFYVPWLAHVPGGLVLFWIIFGPARVKKVKPGE